MTPGATRADWTMRYRPATPDDLPECAAIWRTALNDYLGRLNQAPIPDDLAAVLRLYRHLKATDPEGFVVAEGPDGISGASRIVAFTSTVRRGDLWFLSMLFVRPDAQGSGIGRTLLRRVMPPAGGPTLATCTDSAQPISNAMYASLGMVPRLPLFRLVGRADRPAELPALPDGIRPIRFDELDDADAGNGLGRAALADEIAELDRNAAGFEHPQDHQMIRAEGRRGFLFLGSDGSALGYGYASEAGRVGPIAVRDRDLIGPVIAHLVTQVEPRGAFGIWLPGAAEGAMAPLLRAGFRLDGFPVLLCWDRPLVDFARYVPISPGLL